MRLCENTRGFTLIETMIALAILAVITSLFPLWLHVIDHSEPDGVLEPMEVELFFQQAGLEIREASGLKVAGNKLLLQKCNGDIVSYQLKNEVIRRRVNGRGNVWMLQNVKEFHLKPIGKGVVMKITGKKGRTYERTLFPFVPKAP